VTGGPVQFFMRELAGMRRAAFSLLSFSLFAGVLSSFAADAPRKAPDFAIQTGPDKYIWLSDYPGKTIVLAFILTTCPHCQFTTGILTNLEKEYGPKGVVFLESAIEPMSSLHIPDFRKALNVTFPVGYNDQKYAATFLGVGPDDPLLMPQMVVIDAKGMISTKFSGDEPGFERPQQEATIRAAIDKAMGAKPAAPKPGAAKPGASAPAVTKK
jgi:peroxiredoxin